MTMLHKLKLKTPYIEPVLSGEKTFEVRENDRGFNKGDYIKFIPTHMNGDTYKDTELEVRTYEITYVHSGLGVKEGYCVFGIKECYKLMEERPE